MTDTQTHTPGPWLTCAYQPCDWGVYAESDGHDIALVRTSEADTALIAAAPDLLAALDYTVTEYDAVESFDSAMDAADLLTEIIQRARAAIARAKGEPTA